MNFQSIEIAKQQCILSIYFLVFLLIVAGPVFSQEPGEEVDNGLYKLNRAPTPVYFVTGVAVEKLSSANLPGMKIMHKSLNGKFGRFYSLFNMKTKRQVKMSVAVYRNVAEAENAALEFLNTVSGVFKTGSQSGQMIGTHSWFLDSSGGSGAVVFVYNNSLFYIFSSDYTQAEDRAGQIVQDLRSGKNGIRLGKQVLLPAVTNVKLPKTVKKGVREEIGVEGNDPEKRALDFFVATPAGQVEATSLRTVKAYKADRMGTVELKIYAINDLNVVSEVYVKKVEIKGEK
jgi:hypothetical protein